MSNGKKPYHDEPVACWSPVWLAAAGVASVLVFWIPIVAPLIQALTLIQCLRAARWGLAEAWSLALGVGGALLGFCLFLARNHLGLS